MNRAITCLLILTTAQMIISCSFGNDLGKYHGKWGMFTPKPFLMGELPQGDDSYSTGFRDGCNSSISAGGVGMLSSTYDDIYLDGDKVTGDSEYYKGKTLGANYCMYYMDWDPL